MAKPFYKVYQDNVGPLTNTSVSVNADTLVLARNDSRNGFIIVNDSTNVVYLSLGAAAAVANSGIRLNANGGAFQIDGGSLWTGVIRGIAVGGASVVTVCEF